MKSPTTMNREIHLTVAPDTAPRRDAVRAVLHRGREHVRAHTAERVDRQRRAMRERGKGGPAHTGGLGVRRRR